MDNTEIFKTRPTRVEINLSNISHNIEEIRNRIGNKKIMGIVKANAYGHGLVEISKHIQKDVDYLGVAYIEEAVILRNSGVKIPILVLGAVNDWQIKEYLEHDIDLTGSSLEKIENINKEARKLGLIANVHLKIDTGMGRIGVQWDRVEPFFKGLDKYKHIKIVGIFSHFANSGNDKEYTQLQIERFKSAIEIYRGMFKNKPLLHISNSTALDHEIEGMDMVRPGLALYGYIPNMNLKPAMTFKTKVSYFKVLGQGESIGYNRTYTLERESRIITLPVGYADGYPKELSNRGRVYLRNRYYPVVGNVCMDQFMVDITPKGEAYNGDDVELWGDNIPIYEIGNLSNKSIYQLLTGIGSRVPRDYIE